MGRQTTQRGGLQRLLGRVGFELEFEREQVVRPTCCVCVCVCVCAMFRFSKIRINTAHTEPASKLTQ
jgi:hypothetical protein